MTDVVDLGEKAVTRQALARSVRVPIEQTSAYPRDGLDGGGLLWMVAQAADEFEPWGVRVKIRDYQLRGFIGTESLFTSALGVVCARNAAFDWFVHGAKRTAAAMHRVLEEADDGRGWASLVTKLSIDLYSQDSGAFMEVVRASETADSPVIALGHLDAGRCWHTGDPLQPVIYLDRLGKHHLLPWWNVVALAEMPGPVEVRPGLQFSALTRLLMAAQITKNVAIYQKEKSGGRNTRSIHLIQGVTTQQLTDALSVLRTTADAQGLQRFVNPLLLGTIDPEVHVDIKTLDLASIPDGWNAEEMFKHYISQIAMAFLSDYQEFAPLPGGGLGTSAQSQVLHMKSRGKGPALFMKLITQAMNSRVLPANVEFGFEEQDLEAERIQAEIIKLRREGRKVAIESGELSLGEARQEAVDAGDLAQELFEAAGGLDATPEGHYTDTERIGVPGEATIAEGEKAHRLDQCMQRGCSAVPEYEILWAEGKARAWFCSAHLVEFNNKNPFDINDYWPIAGRATRRTPYRAKKDARPRWYDPSG